MIVCLYTKENFLNGKNPFNCLIEVCITLLNTIGIDIFNTFSVLIDNDV